VIRFIVVDGPDAAGKTTLVASLACALGYESLKTPPLEYRARRNHYDDVGVSPLARFTFYADGLAASCDEIRAGLRKGHGVVVDRYVDSLVLHHNALDPSTHFAALALAYDYPTPDLRIILTAHIDTLEERIAKRATEQRSDSHLERDPEYLNRVLEQFRQIAGPDVLHLDTGTADSSETLRTALRELQP